jgi:hypothetical protein
VQIAQHGSALLKGITAGKENQNAQEYENRQQQGQKRIYTERRGLHYHQFIKDLCIIKG